MSLLLRYSKLRHYKEVIAEVSHLDVISILIEVVEEIQQKSVFWLRSFAKRRQFNFYSLSPHCKAFFKSFLDSTLQAGNYVILTISV